MNKQEAFEKMQTLMPFINQLNIAGTVTLEVEHQLMLKDLWDNYWFFSSLNLGCPTCITEAMSIVQSYYEREYPIYQSTQAKDNEDENPNPEPTVKKKNNGRK